jgi:hypothetical protein
MAIQYTRAYSRKDKSVNFYEDREAFLEYIKTAYIDNGMCMSFREKTYLDENELVVEYISVWTSKAAADQATIDTNMISEHARREAYNKANGIISLYVRSVEVEQ